MEKRQIKKKKKNKNFSHKVKNSMMYKHGKEILHE